MADTRRYKLKANEEHTKNLLSWGRIDGPEKNYVDEDGNWTSFKDAHVSSSLVKPVDSLYICAPHLFEKVYLDEPLQNQEEKVLNVGNINDPNNDYFKLSPDKKELFKVTECKFIMKAQNKHAQDLISYGMTIPGEIFVYVPSPDKPIDDSNPLCFVSEDKASEFSSWPEGVSRACFFPVYNWVSLQLPGIMACSEVVCTISQPSLDEPSEDKSEERFSESNIKSLDKYLLDLQSDMLHLSEAIVAALECLRESSEENNDTFVKAYNKYRSKRGQTVLGEE